MTITLEDSAAILLIMGTLLIVVLGLYQFVQIGRLVAVSYAALAKMFSSFESMQQHYVQSYANSQFLAGQRQNRGDMRLLVDERLSNRYDEIAELLNNLYHALKADRKKYFLYFMDIMEEIDRGNKISNLLQACLSSGTLYTFGLYGVLRVHCEERMKDCFRPLTLECNNEDYRLPEQLEQELTISYLLLFIYFAFDRAPKSLHMYLQFDENCVSFTLTDDDRDAIGGLELSQMAIEEWPASLQRANNIARLFNGYTKTDASYAAGLKFSMSVPFYADKLLLE